MKTFTAMLPYLVPIVLLYCVRLIIVPKENRKAGRSVLWILLFAAIIIGAFLFMILLVNVVPKWEFDIPLSAAVAINFVSAVAAGKLINKYVVNKERREQKDDKEDE